jgi:hypothetical protein
MKQLFTLSALLITTFLLTACGNNDAQQAQAPTPEPVEATSPAQTTEPDDADEVEETNEAYETDEATSDAAYTVGIIEGDRFASEWLNLRFEAPEAFIMATQEEMLGMMELGLEVMEIDQRFANWADMVVVHEMMAMLPTGAAQVSIVTERLVLSGITTEQYIEASFASVESLLGWDVEFNDDLRTIEFAGLEWYTYTATINAFGMDWSYQYIIRRFDDRMALITIYAMAGQEAYIDTLFEGFSAY